MIFRILFFVIIVYLGIIIHNIIMDKEVDTSSLVLGIILAEIYSFFLVIV